MMKDECGGKSMMEFIGLRTKLYAYKMCEGKEEKKCKGVKKMLLKRISPLRTTRRVCKRGLNKCGKCLILEAENTSFTRKRLIRTEFTPTEFTPTQ